MAKGPDFLPWGYGPVPDNDPPSSLEGPSPHYRDGYRNRMPYGCKYESPSAIWIDRVVYPDRNGEYASDMQADEQDISSRAFRVTVGNLTGKNPGPIN